MGAVRETGGTQDRKPVRKSRRTERWKPWPETKNESLSGFDPRSFLIVKMEKGEGCDHMSCSCGKSYCWACGQDFNSAHYRRDEEGRDVWIGCPRNMDLEEVVLEEEIVGSEEWYAKAMFYRRFRRTNAWKSFNIKNFLKLHSPFNGDKYQIRPNVAIKHYLYHSVAVK